MRKTLLLAAVMVSLGTVAFGQTMAGMGAITGSVRDASGAAVPNAAVVVANESKGIKRTLTSNEAGIFNAPALLPAPGYRVTASKEGFAQYAAREIQILVGQNVNINITLEVAKASTVVEVSAVQSVVEDTKTDVSQVVNARQILDLPINGRRVDSFVLLSPAIVPDGAFGLVSFRGVAGGNSYLTDGNDTTNQFYNENAGRTRISSQISQDAVQEFQVISNNFAAEFGRASGGVINTVTKSGQNELHGTGYWFFRNRTLNARDRYANFNPPEVRHQVGGSLGGAIKKDKVFYFVNLEATRRRFPLIATVTTPPLFSAGGVFQDVQPNGSATCAAPATPTQCATAKQFVTTRNFAVIKRTADSELGFAKLDWRSTERNAFSFSMNYLRWISPNGIQTQAVLADGNGIGNNANSTVRTRYGRASWTSIPNPNAVNEARFGWFKDRLFDDASPEFLVPALGRAGLTINGVNNLGYATSYPRLNPSEQRFQFADNLSWTRGRHAMKFGADISHTEDYQNQLSNQFGTYSYASFTNFARDFSGNPAGEKNWTQYSQRFGNPVVDTNLLDTGLYAQDTYRATPQLVVNYGVRYEYAKIPQPSLVNPDYPKTGVIPSPGKNFAPRVGAAYSLKDGKTVIRAGYGLFYARYQTGLINSFFLNNNIYQKAITLTAVATGPVFPNNLPSTNLNPPPGTTDISLTDKNLRNPYTHQANVAIERQLSPDVSMSVSYIWSRGVRLYTIRDLNTGPLGAPITYNILDSSNNVTGSYTTPTYRGPRTDPRYRRVNQVENGAISYYDGLALQVNKRFSKGFQGSVAYTWSHAIDLNQGGGNNNIFFSGGPTSFANGEYAAEKGSSALDIRHRLVINSVWNPTFTKSDMPWARYLVNNWQFSQITTLQSSPPVLSTININGAAFPGALVTASLNGLGGTNRVPFVPLSNLDVDRIYRVDARVAKVIPINDRMKLYMQFEAFNMFNTPYDTARRNQRFQENPANLTLIPLATYGTGSASQGFPDGTNARRAQVSLRFIF
ncbi:MAG: TonB-dependent receptor [Bryobacterales bacterium]|nr:TonB-dependent receptor [Bryobacterales bacterium]